MAAKTSKKRKASELEDRPRTSGQAKKTAGKKTKKEPAADPIPDPPFKVVCPFTGQADYKLGQERAQLGEDFSFEYAVKSLKPDTVWEDIKSYRHVKLAEMSVSVGDAVYVLHNTKAKELHPDANEKQILAFDKKNCWVGKILQARAVNDREVYILVAWLYWPNEIPKAHKAHPHFYGRDYADNELIMSNWLDIIDANSISAKAEAYCLDEEDEDAFLNVPDRFWRQTFNAGETPENSSHSEILSALKSACKCERPINPGKKVLRCASDTCKTWNHEQCIIDEIGGDLWSSYEAGSMDQYVRDHAPETKSMGLQIAEAVGAAGQDIKDHLKNIVEDGIAAVATETTPKLESKNEDAIEDEVDDVDDVKPNPPVTLTQRSKPKKAHDAWKASLAVVIIFDNQQPPVARVTEKEGQKRSWDLRIKCLVCGHTMD